MDLGKQETLPGFEGYVCIFQCLTHCPYPDGPCPYDDPDIGEPIEYPEFFWWRLEHLTEDQKRQLMEPGLDMMIVTPDCLDDFYPEPEPVGKVYRCLRCLSTKVHFGEVWIVCRHCGYNEPLIDFPENIGQGQVAYYEASSREQS